MTPVFIEYPDPDWIKSGENAICIDMDCDGGKKVLIRDIDGTLSRQLGQGSVIFSKSEFVWGDKTRGSTNSNIPPAISRTLADGKNRGIVREEQKCRKSKNFWQCGNLDEYGVLVFESMDKDSTKRRLSPLAIKSDKTGIIDLVIF